MSAARALTAALNAALERRPETTMKIDSWTQREHDRYFAEAPICASCFCPYDDHVQVERGSGESLECAVCIEKCAGYKPYDERDYAPTEED